jgi:hypothetical protein
MTTVVNHEAATPNPPSFTRLHITPLDSELLSVVLSTSIRPRARNISYHTLSTFPEKRYGFLELPVEDADKLKQKLNGAVLKGVKIRIEPARPERTPAPLGDAAMAAEKNPKKEKKPKDKSESKKRKRDREEVPGAVLEPGRKIKRGWTTTQDEPTSRKDKRDKSDKDKDKKRAKKEVKSKYTTHAECLIKTSVPNTHEDNEAEGEKKRKKSRSKEAVIHEFEKTTKFPTFLKTADSSSSKKKNLEFVDGKGWVDEDGTVVEAVKTRPATVARATPPTAKTKVKPQHEEHTHSSSGGGATSDESEDGPEAGSGSELSGDDEPTKADSPSNRVKSNAAMSPPTLSSILKPEPARPQSSSSAKSLTIKIPPATPKVHPLEALYKRPKQPGGTPTQVATSEPEPEPFSFFGNAGSESEDGDEDNDDTAPTVQIPMTPFTRQDFESRGVRSAAPTPDTAHINRTFKLWPRGGTEDIDEESEEDPKVDQEPLDDEDGRSTSADRSNEGQEAQPATGFQDWFWENRGDLNRSWKKRRKTVAKEKRYRENQARADRAI